MAARVAVGRWEEEEEARARAAVGAHRREVEVARADEEAAAVEGAG
jgi:hypothetical protein